MQPATQKQQNDNYEDVRVRVSVKWRGSFVLLTIYYEFSVLYAELHT